MNGELRTVPIASLRERPQPRGQITTDSVRDLAASIASVGLQQPILCEEDGGELIVVEGHRRLVALRDLLKADQATVLVRQADSSPGSTLARQLVCNLQRADLNPMERACGIRDLIARGGSTAEAAARLIGLSPATVTKSLSLLRLSEEMQRRVADGSLPVETAYMLARIDDIKQQALLFAEVSGGTLSRTALARKLKRLERRSSGRPPARVTAALGSGRSVTLAGSGMTLDSVVEWLDQLLARARKAKQQGLTLETFVRTLRDQAQKA
jgi:ParB family chromosome partitioning protein